MFNLFDNNSILTDVVYEHRISGFKSSEVVLNALSEKADFGQGMFQKVLQKTILKSGNNAV